MPKPIIILTEDKVNERILFEPGSGENSIKSKFNTSGDSSGDYSFSVGEYNVASGDYSFAEGRQQVVSGDYSHAEGGLNHVFGFGSHAEGVSNTIQANSYYTHVEGQLNETSASTAHLEGYGTIAYNNYEHAQGRHNISHKKNDNFDESGNTIHSVGIGINARRRMNAVEIMNNGDCYLYHIGGYNGVDIGQTLTLQTHLDTSEIDDREWADIFGEHYGPSYMIVIDDFPDDKIEEIVEDSGCDSLWMLVEVAAEDDKEDVSMFGENICTFDDYIEFGGETVEAWRITCCGEDNPPDNMMFIKSPDLDFETMQRNSMVYDVNNRYCPFIAVLSDDGVAVRYDGPQYLEDNYTLMFVKEI